jgi:hypothetical protein
VTAKRLLALLAAVAMVAGAWIVRTKVIDKGSSASDGTSNGSPSATSTTQPQTARQMVCVTELEPVCRAVGGDYKVEPAGVTLASLSSSELTPNLLWVTVAPWPAMADAARRRAGFAALPTDRGTQIGSTAVVIAAPTDRVSVLKAACPALAWTCLGDKMNRPWKDIGGQAVWQDVTFRHRDPLTSAEGLSVLGASLAGRAGHTDLSSADLSTTDLRAWANQLESSNKQPASDPLGSVVIGSRFDTVGTLEAFVPTGGRVAMLQPLPLGQVSAVIFATSGKVPADVLTGLQAAAGKNGWSTAVAPTGLPDAVGMEATQQLWRDVIR